MVLNNTIKLHYHEIHVQTLKTFRNARFWDADFFNLGNREHKVISHINRVLKSFNKSATICDLRWKQTSAIGASVKSGYWALTHHARMCVFKMLHKALLVIWHIRKTGWKKIDSRQECYDSAKISKNWQFECSQPEVPNASLLEDSGVQSKSSWRAWMRIDYIRDRK